MNIMKKLILYAIFTLFLTQITLQKLIMNSVSSHQLEELGVTSAYPK